VRERIPFFVAFFPILKLPNTKVSGVGQSPFESNARCIILTGRGHRFENRDCLFRRAHRSTNIVRMLFDDPRIPRLSAHTSKLPRPRGGSISS
jgi:hypothetical protein